MDAGSKLIQDYLVTPANVPDYQVFPHLLDENEIEVWADSGYCLKPCFEAIPENCTAHILEKSTRGHKLTQAQKISNTEKSKVRVRVEHVFGYINTAMKGFFQCCIGLESVKIKIALINLAYNMERYEFLVRA